MSAETGKERLDQRIVRLGLADSRSRAQALIAAAVVTVDGVVVTRASHKTAGAIQITDQPNPWVSRAALKLVHALDHFELKPHGIAADIGASTGGFTEVLIARGADQVHAVDVGNGQIHDRVRALPGVHVHEGINARALPDGLLPPLDWIVSDVSFISLTKALPPVLSLAKSGAHLIALIKPQFEAGLARVGKGGIVTDPATHDDVQETIRTFLSAVGWEIIGITESPITGSDGNREFLIAAQLT